MKLSKIATSNNWTQVYLVLKEQILQRQFGPNEKIAIPELAELLGVSPTPIRDALSRLEAEGLIRTVPKVGTFVAPVTRELISDLIETRMMMECWVVDKWQELPEELIRKTAEEMTAISDKAQALLTPGTIELYDESNLDLQFHLTLIRAGGNNRMLSSYETTMNYRIFNLAAADLTWDMYCTSVDQHSVIASALSQGHLSEAKTAICAHLNSSRRNLLTILENSGGQL